MKVEIGEQQDLCSSDEVKDNLSIMHAVDCPLDEITVNELCKKAGISRRSFYRRFCSKYDLYWWWPVHIHQYYLAEVGRTLDWETGYYHHIRLLLMEKDFFKVAAWPALNATSERGVIFHCRRQALIETLKNYRHIEVDDDLMFCIESWVKTETEVFSEWHRLGATPPPREAAQKLVSLIPRRLYEALAVE